MRILKISVLALILIIEILFVVAAIKTSFFKNYRTAIFETENYSDSKNQNILNKKINETKTQK